MRERLSRRAVLGYLLAGVAFGSLGCRERNARPTKLAEAGPSPPDARTVRGVLEFYPSDVQSVQAWYGHTFMVDGTPILPTDRVPEELLRKHVGRPVTVTGVWQSGTRWTPTEEEKRQPMPVDPEKEVVMRGDGLRATSISSGDR